MRESSSSSEINSVSASTFFWMRSQPMHDFLVEPFAVLHQQHRGHAADIPQRGVEVVANGAQKILFFGDFAGKPSVGRLKLRGALANLLLQL